MIELTLSPTRFPVQKSTVLTIVVRNIGRGTCGNLTLRLERPPGLLLIDGSEKITIPWLAAGEHREQRITVMARHPGQFRVSTANFSYRDASDRPRHRPSESWTVNVVVPAAREAASPDPSNAPATERTSELGKVFISYRWRDSAARADHLYSELCREFSADWVHLDRERRRLGGDFHQRLDAALRASTAMLALIGPQWNPEIGPPGTRRLDLEQDIVRYEIRTALQNGMHVIPVLCDNADMPHGTDLPEDIRNLASRDAAEIGKFRVRDDIAKIIEALRPHVGGDGLL